ncbi:MAG: hypothetical protein IT376_13505 [Polyangiaceae bacterium]|nr:hypothetical protein [Polyangiaceae bacterium]
MDPRLLHAERSPALHAEVARRLCAEPAILERARATLESWIERGGRSVPLLLEWRAVLARPPEAVAAFLTDRSERAAWLRSASPFAGALDPRTRLAILRSIPRGGSAG